MQKYVRFCPLLLVLVQDKQQVALIIKLGATAEEDSTRRWRNERVR